MRGACLTAITCDPASLWSAAVTGLISSIWLLEYLSNLVKYTCIYLKDNLKSADPQQFRRLSALQRCWSLTCPRWCLCKHMLP